MNEILWYYNVEVTYWNDSVFPYGKKNSQAMVAAYSVTDACKKICNWYGDEKVENISIEIIEDTEDGILFIDD